MSQSIKLTGQEIIERLKASRITVEDFAYNGCPYSEEDSKALKALKKVIDLKDPKAYYWDNPEYKALCEEANKRRKDYEISIAGEYKEVEQFGGEGQGDQWWSVKHFKEHDVYLKVVGYYQSHYGTDIYDWSHVKEVRPAQKTVTVYE